MIRTEAWILDEGGVNGSQTGAAALRLGELAIPDLSSGEVLVEPLVGCWEANMSHALDRKPVDICKLRRERQAVLGNAGVVRVLRCGGNVESVRPGDVCIVFCNGEWDADGYPVKIYAYDAAGSIGILARKTKLHERQLIPIPEDTRHSLGQWAAFSLRYITAWANWRLALNCWKSHRSHTDDGVKPIVWGWGGGVAYAELSLATLEGACATLISSNSCRLELIRHNGMTALDRQSFLDLQFYPERYASDADYRNRYLNAESTFLERVRHSTEGAGVSIFVDYIGAPVYRATLKALSRTGVITTAGWKEGMTLTTLRALECMSWRVHVHTHYARYQDGLDAVAFGDQRGWMPGVDDTIYRWEDIPQLADDYAQNRITSYFPLYAVNSE
jgi:NADPH:quinone reductase-like Zn-dependent oxidoreductase